MKINTILPQDNKFLQIINTIVNNPKTLYYMGKLPEKRLATVAIVGTRKPTVYGRVRIDWLMIWQNTELSLLVVWR